MKRWARLVLALALAALLGLCARRWVVSTIRIAGTSMEGALCSGDVALIWRPHGDVRRGDVVECRFPGREGTYVKRVIGLPGERIAFEGGALYVDGKPVAEPYVSSLTDDFAIALGADEYLLLGDNRAQSYDSRAEDMGPVARDDILGRVCWVLWPLNRFGPA